MDEIERTFLDWLKEPMVIRIFAIIIGAIIILFANYFIKKGLNKSIKNTDSKYKARKAVNLIAYVFLMLVILFVFNDKLKNFNVVLGIIGAGVAFALQDIILSMAGWLSIVMSATINVGERIKVGEIKGDVIDIGVLTTTIMEVGEWINGDLYNGCITSISNSFVFKEKVHNYSAEYPFLWDELTVPIRLQSDYKAAKEIFIKVLDEICGEYAKQSQVKWNKLSNKYRVEEARVMPMVTLTFDENWITFTLRYVVDYKMRRSTKDLIYTRILDEINKKDKNISIASSAMEITEITDKK